MRLRRFCAPLLILAALAAAPRAEEGFWTYNSIPRAAIKAKYRFEVTDEWLRHLQLATVRFGGGTGSIVSPRGLVLTNHHIALGSLQRLSTPEKDYVKDGFYAPTTADELKVPGMTLSVLQAIEDVTATIEKAAGGALTPEAAAAARQKAIQALVGEPVSGTSRQVVPLYAGAVHHLYTYKVYTDVRLVFGAEYQAGFYGGDPDNFTYPRYNFDVSMFRLYEDDRPAVTPNFLSWSPAGTREGDLVFTTGHPGSTQRLNTVAHLEYRRDVALPFSIASNEMREAAILEWAARGPEQARQVKSELFRVQNSLKSQRGQLEGLRDVTLMGRKEAAECRLRAALATRPERQQALGDAWDLIARSLVVARQLDDQRNFIANAAGLNSQLFAQARALVRGAYGHAAETSASRPAAPGGDRGPVDLEREQINLTASLKFMQRQLGADHAIVQRILAGQEPAARAAELVGRTRITDPEIRALLEAGGRAAIDVATDPMIVLARSLEADAQAVAQRYEADVTHVQAAAYPKIGQAMFAVDGAAIYPDATGTLRLSYGTVRSYREDGQTIAPYTDLAGLFERAARHAAQPPYDLPARWVAAREALDLKTPFNFVSTNDIVGGNSGSAVVNRKGELVGLIFDGNIQSLPGYFSYDAAVNRAVSVDSRAIVEALRKVYRAGALADELTGSRRFGTH